MMMTMERCNNDAMSMPMDNDASSSGATASEMGSSHPQMPMAGVRCNAMAWTDETDEKEEGRLKVLVISSDPVTGAAVTTAEQTMPRMELRGAQAERSYMECKWWSKLWQLVARVLKLCSTSL
jgi:hypothetical protein